METLITFTEDLRGLTLECVHMEPIERCVMMVYSNTIDTIKSVNVKKSVLQAIFVWKKATIAK